MKNLLVLTVLLTISALGICQSFEFPKPKDTAIEILVEKAVYQDSIYRLDTVKINYFDDKGNISKTIHIHKNKVNSYTTFMYDKDDRMIEEIGANPSEDLKIMWTLDNSSKFLDETGVIWRYKKFQHFDNTTLSSWYRSDSTLIFTTQLEFDSLNRPIKEISNHDPNSTSIVIGQFKPRSTEIDPNPIEKSEIEVKKCKYLNSMNICEYYDSDRLMSTDTTEFLNDLIARKVITRTNGEKIYEGKYVYEDYKLIQYRKFYTGGDPYGGMTDMVPGDFNTTYNYDKNGQLLSEDMVFPNGAILRTTHLYVKK